MSQEEENFLDDDQSKILSLFRKRSHQNIVISQDKYEKLYENLCCTICRELFNNPVYLKCSHRFCKDCIEKYIRINEKKSCPNCRGGLSTKRDLRYDMTLTCMMDYAFKNIKDFKKNIQKCQSQVLSQIKFVPVHSASQKRERTESLRRQMSYPTRSPRKRNMNAKTIENQSISPENQVKLKKTISEGQLNLKKVQSQPQFIKSYKKKAESIEEQKKNQEVVVKQEHHEVIQINQNEMIDENEENKKIQTTKEEEINPQVLRARQMLMKHFQTNYIKKLVEETKTLCTIKLKLQRLPLHPFTPKLKEKYIIASFQSTLSDIAKIVAHKLNIENRSVVRLYIKNNEGKYEQLPSKSRKKKLAIINEELWKGYEGVDTFNMKSIGRYLWKESLQECKRLQKILYYVVSYETLIKK